MTENTILANLKLIRSGLILELQRVELAIMKLEEQEDLQEPVPEEKETPILQEEEEEYDPNMSFEHKIRWVLATIGSGNATEITDQIMQLENRQTNRSMVLEIVTHTAIKMFSVQKINATRRNGVIIYSLKD